MSTEMYIGPVIMVVIACIISILVQYKMRKPLYTIKTVFFYFVLNYGSVSFMKMLLGYRKYTIFESFDDIQKVTYYHYAFPVILGAVLMPILLNWLTKEKIDKLISIADSIYIMCALVFYLIMDKNTNLQTVCFIFISVLTAYSLCKNNRNVEHDTRACLKQKLIFSLIVSIMWAVKVILFIPNELYLNNINEFQVAYSSFLGILLFESLIFIGIYCVACCCFLTEKETGWLNTVTFTIALLGYFQEMFLNGKLNMMDGSVQTWEKKTVAINITIWVFFILVLIILRMFFQKKLDAIIKFISIYVCLIQVFTLGYMVVQTDFYKDENLQLTMDGLLELDDKNNIVVFVLDWYDEQILDELLEDNNDFLSPLKDFTHYKNATSCYAFTQMSIPYLLSGLKWENDMQEGDYRQYAYRNGTFLHHIHNCGYSIGLYTDMYDYSLKDLIINIKDTSTVKMNKYSTIQLMSKCAKYKLMPFVMKPYFWYSTSEVARLIKDDNVYNANDDVPFYNKLSAEGVKIAANSGELNGAFRFIHMYGAHLPYIINEDMEYSDDADIYSQAIGSMRIVFEYIEQMKKLGIYDSSTIIITADHGQNLYIGDFEGAKAAGFEPTSSPILLVKQAYQTQSQIVDSMAPVSHEDFIPSIYKEINIFQDSRGRSFDEINEDEDRNRFFIYGRHNDIPFCKYLIKGDVGDFDSWYEVPLE